MGMNAPQASRRDPIGDRFYTPLDIADRAERACFYCCAAISFAPLLIDPEINSKTHKFSIALFAIFVISSFIIAATNRLYFFPRANDARRRGLISDAFGIPLTTLLSSGYYNNTETEPHRRLGICTLESLFFTKSILAKLAISERLGNFSYMLIWLLAAMWRDTQIGLLLIGAQFLFSEQIVARWIRIEWARARAERLYESTYQFFRTGGDDHMTAAYAIAFFTEYEAGKSVSAIAMPKRIFLKEKPRLDAEWQEIASGLKTAPVIAKSS